MTPGTVNAPILRRTIVNGGSTVFTVPLVESMEYGLKSTLILANGAGGVIQSLHAGQWGGAPTRTAIAGAPAAGITLTWGAVAGGNAIQLTVANASGYTYTAELQIENLSSASITIASEV